MSLNNDNQDHTLTRAQLETERLITENELRKQMLELKKLELESKKTEETTRKLHFSPLSTAVIGGLLGLFGTILGSYTQGCQNLSLEKSKFEFNKQLELQKQKHELIIKMIGTGDGAQAARNLLFLVKANLIEDTGKHIAWLASNPDSTPVLPNLSSANQGLKREDQLRLAEMIGSTNTIESDTATASFLKTITRVPEQVILEVVS